MKIIHSSDIELMTGFKLASKQVSWFEKEGITYRVNSHGKVWTTDDWLNGKDKYQPENDGFNLEFLQDDNEPWIELGLTPDEWFTKNASKFVFHPDCLPKLEELPKSNWVNSGVYFLYYNNEIVYIGQSIEIEFRLSAHTRNFRKFDYARVLTNIPTLYLKEVEMYYIDKFKPDLNIQFKPVHSALREH